MKEKTKIVANFPSSVPIFSSRDQTSGEWPHNMSTWFLITTATHYCTWSN